MATAMQADVSPAEPSAVRYRCCRTPPRDPLPSAAFNAMLGCGSRVNYAVEVGHLVLLGKIAVSAESQSEP